MKKFLLLALVGFIIYIFFNNSSVFSDSTITINEYEVDQDYRLDEGGPFIVYIVETKLKDKKGSTVFSCVDFVDATETALQNGKESGLAKASEYLSSTDK